MNIPQLYHEWIVWIGETTGLADEVLHIHAGLGILLLARVVTGRSLGTFIPFLFVGAAEAMNEIMDYLATGLNQADALSDVGYTLFWPFVISLGVRIRPLRFPVSDRPADSAASPELTASQSAA